MIPPVGRPWKWALPGSVELGGPSTVLWTYPEGKDGGRLVLVPPARGADCLNITLLSCALPQYRRTDVYSVYVPSNPFPARHQSMTAVPPEAHAQ